MQAVTPLKSIVLVLIASFVGSFGAVFLKTGAARLKMDLGALVSNWRLAAGIFAFLASSFIFVAGIREGELTILYPMLALGNLWTLLWSYLFFREPLTRSKFFGIGMILIGVFFLQLGRT